MWNGAAPLCSDTFGSSDPALLQVATLHFSAQRNALGSQSYAGIGALPLCAEKGKHICAKKGKFISAKEDERARLGRRRSKMISGESFGALVSFHRRQPSPEALMAIALQQM